MLAQLPPFLSQRRHWYWKLVGLFDHWPRLAFSVLPSWGVPLIVGGLVLTGATLLAAPPAVANAARAATTTAATPAPKAAPRTTQRFFCLVCIPNPFRDRSRCLTRRRLPKRRAEKTVLSRRLQLGAARLTCAEWHPISA